MNSVMISNNLIIYTWESQYTYLNNYCRSLYILFCLFSFTFHLLRSFIKFFFTQRKCALISTLFAPKECKLNWALNIVLKCWCCSLNLSQIAPLVSTVPSPQKKKRNGHIAKRPMIRGIYLLKRNPTNHEKENVQGLVVKNSRTNNYIFALLWEFTQL